MAIQSIDMWKTLALPHQFPNGGGGGGGGSLSKTRRMSGHVFVCKVYRFCIRFYDFSIEF